MEWWNNLSAWWLSLPLVLQILLIISFSTFSIVEMFKRIFTPWMNRKNRKSILTLVALIAGVAAAVTGYFVAPGKLPMWSWIFIGVVNGYLTTLMHKGVMLLIAWKFPALAEKLKG